MLGFFTAVTKLIPREAMRDSVKASVPAGTEDLNLKAFDAGYNYFEKEYRNKETAGGDEGTVAAETVE